MESASENMTRNRSVFHGEMQSVFNNMVESVENKSWPEFMRRLGYSYREDHRLSLEEKQTMLHKWLAKTNISAGALSCCKEALRGAFQELYQDEQKICTRLWPRDLQNNRKIAQIFYDLIKRYSDEDDWMRDVIRKTPLLRQCDISRIRHDYFDNINEQKYQMLECWRNSKSLDDFRQVLAGLRQTGLVSPFHEEDNVSVNRFGSYLRQKAEKETQIDVPVDINKAIRAVTLQILKNPAGKLPEYLDSVGQYNRRQDMAQIYESPRGDLTIEQLFPLAEKNAEYFSKRISPESAKTEYIMKQSNNIMVTGQAGIGKTTLTKMFTKMVLDGQLFPSTKFIIYVKIREIDFNSSCDINEFLATYCGFDGNESKFLEFSNEDYKQLHQEHDLIVMVFDGMDEANTDDFTEEPKNWNPQKAVLPSTILRHIMQGKIFPKAKKLWTSRQRQAYELHEKLRPETMVQILGLDEQAQEDLGKQLCTEEGWPSVKKYLEDHPDIKVICYVPVMCIIAISSVHASMVRKENVQLHTMTDVLAYALDIYARSEHLHKKQREIPKVSHLAWDGFLEGKLLFTEDDFRNAKIEKEAFQAFLITAVDKRTNFRLKLVVGDQKSSFSHLIWQEKFAAIRAVMFSNKQEFFANLKKLLESRWEVVAKLMYGLCHNPTMERLKPIFPGYFSDDIPENRKALKEFASKLMLKYTQDDGKKPEAKMQKLIQVCTWVRETNSADFVDAVRTNMPKVIDIAGDVMPSDIRCICYVIPDGHTITVGSDEIARFISNSLLLLADAITKKNLRVSKLFLEGNNLNSVKPFEDFCKCLDNVDRLSLLKCRIGDPHLDLITNAIADRKEQMEHLDLSHNKISIVGTRSLSKCLHNLKSLDIDSCDFDAVKFEELSRTLTSIKHQISLHVGYTDINNRAATALCMCLHNIKNMAYARCGILDDGFMQFTRTIRELQRPMHEIVLSTNISATNDLSNMSDDQKAAEVASCLKNVKRLKLNCWIKPNGAAMLSRAINSLPCPMESLDVTGNKFGDEGAKHFASCLGNVSELIMGNCAISKEGYQVLKEAFNSLSETSKPKVVFGTIEDVQETMFS